MKLNGIQILAVILFLFSYPFILCKKENFKQVKSITCDNLINDAFAAGDDYYIKIPTAFTPNGDGLNDRLAVFIKNISSAKLSIYDSRANLVFETADLTVQWDPATESVMGKTYYYRIEATSSNNKKLGLCGEIHPLKCVPKNNPSYYFQSQWNGNTFLIGIPSAEYNFCP